MRGRLDGTHEGGSVADGNFDAPDARGERLRATLVALEDALAAARRDAERQRHQLAVARRISAAAAAPGDLDDLLRRVLEEVLAILGARRGAVMLADAERRWLIGRVGLHYPPGSVEAIRRPLFAAAHPDEDIYASVVRAGEQLVVGLDHPARYRPNVLGLPPGFRVLTPIRAGQETIGVFSAIWLDRETASDDDLALLRLMAEQVGGVVARARLVELAQAELRARTTAEAALAEQYRVAEAARGEARAILDTTEEAMLLLSPDGAITSMNRRAEDLFGRRGAEVIDRPLADFIDDIVRIFNNPEAAQWLRARLTGPEPRFVVDLRQHWPVQRDLTLTSAPVRAANGALLGQLFAFRDVTRERAADRLKDEFVAMVSHELRTPLTSIKGYVDLLRDDDANPLGPEQQEFLTIIQRNVDREAVLVNDLLDIARLEAGQSDLDCRPLDLVPLLRQVAAALRPQCLANAQQVTLHFPPALPLVQGDAARLTQVFTNLLSNAHKYTAAGGRITITATATEAHVRVDVQDTGIGLSVEEQSRLFTKFFRADNAVVRRAGGTGLGLAITRALVEQHGGLITVTSAIGQGSTFSVALPRRTAPPGPAQTP